MFNVAATIVWITEAILKILITKKQKNDQVYKYCHIVVWSGCLYHFI